MVGFQCSGSPSSSSISFNSYDLLLLFLLRLSKHELVPDIDMNQKLKKTNVIPSLFPSL